MANTRLSWGADGTAQAPYYLYFQCFPFPRTSRERANLSNPIAEIILPGVRINRGISHRYSEDAPMMENMAQALGTISDTFDVTKVAALDDLGEVMAHVEDVFTQLGSRYQEDAFGQINSAMGRLELLTTEAGYLGSSKRKYNFSWNLKSTSGGADGANTLKASSIANTFEALSMPVVGGFASEGPIAQGTRMRPPNVWTVRAVNESGGNPDGTTGLWLGAPKPCVLMQVMHGLDNQSFISGVGGPFSYNLVLNFVELENVFNYDGFITSRSEFFNNIG